MEFYLKNLDLKDRINLCKFRCGNSLIPVVSGRFYGVDFEDRICNLCNKREIGMSIIMLCLVISLKMKEINSLQIYIGRTQIVSNLIVSFHVKIQKNYAIYQSLLRLSWINLNKYL